MMETVVSSPLSQAAAAGGDSEKPATQQKQRCVVTSSDASFISPDVVAANTPAALRAEAMRRMEVFVLQTVHQIVSSQQELALREGYLRVIRLQLLVLRLLYSNLHIGVISTQRDVYYHLSRLVPDQECINRTIQQLVQLLGIPRQWLGVVPGTRGCVGGSISFHGVDLRYYGSEGLPLPTIHEDLHVTQGDMNCKNEVKEKKYSSNGFELDGQTRYIIVVEKHAVFFRLMEERIFERLPCVLLTSHGFPTVAARTLLSNLHRASPHISVVALVDYNPSGLSILQQYKHAAGGMRESQYTAVNALRWLGLRSHHITQGRDCSFAEPNPPATAESPVPLRLAPHLPFQRFSRRDAVMMTNLLGRWHAIWEGYKGNDRDGLKVWYDEALRMQQLQVKVELEALYQHSADEMKQTSSSSLQLSDGHGFAAWVCRTILRQDFI